jgi:hypothetical protein
MLTLALAYVSTALADATVTPAAPKLDPTRCTYQDAPLFRDSQSDEVKRLTPTGLYLKQAAGRRHLLFTSAFGSPKRAVVRERGSGKTVATLPFLAAAIVEDDDGKLLGILTLEEAGSGQSRLQLYAPSGAPRWKAPPSLDGFGDNASALVVGELLIVAHFHRIATGSSLAALDLLSGKLRWKADVQQLEVDHSKYWTDVSLERQGQVLFLRGFEAAGCYLQTFDVATGQRRSSQLHKG